jgi:ribosomal protein S27E
MGEINLDEAKINVNGDWFSAEDLANSIQEKMKAGDMKFSGLASALEELNKTMEDSQAIEIRLVLPKEEYKKLKALGGSDDRESVRKAIKAFIGGRVKKTGAEGMEKKKMVIKCPKCKSPIEIVSDRRPLNVECSNCGMGGRLTPENKWAKLD